MSSRLPQREWIVVGLIAGGLLILGLVTWIRGDKTGAATGVAHHLVSQEIEVRIEGAVEKPGLYTLRRGTVLREALELAIPMPEANLQKYKMDRPLHDGQTIKVPAIKVKKSKVISQKSEMPGKALLNSDS